MTGQECPPGSTAGPRGVGSSRVQAVGSWDAQNGTESIGLSRQAGAVRVELRRPDRLNALDDRAAEELRDILGDLSSDESVRAVLLTGAGRAFCAGADVRARFGDVAARGQIAQSMRDVTAPTILALREMPKPVVAAVNGAAAGLGCSIALSCDLVVAGESAFFMLAFANLGLTVDGGASALVPARVGLGRAFVMALLAERVPAAEALAWGLADRVVPDAELATVTEALVLRLAAGPSRSYAATKELINRAQLAALREQLGREADLQETLLASEDFDEGVRAFAGKRPPEFRGR